MTDSPIQITDNRQLSYTILPNDFIDGAMCRADGEYVKIYLMILRLTGSGLPVTPDILADRLNLTQKDVLRAVSYWEKAGLLKPLTVQGSEPGNQAPQPGDQPSWPGSQTAQHGEQPSRPENPTPLSGDQPSWPGNQTPPSGDQPSWPGNPTAPSGDQPLWPGNPTASSGDQTVPDKHALTPREIELSQNRADLSRTIFMAETYLGRPFSHNELNTLCYISDQLGFSCELMEYLIEYCVGKGKKSMRYIEKVAIEWFRSGITTVAEAKEESGKYVDQVFGVMKALGLSGRGPAPVELDYIRHWSELGLPDELITEACSRTLLAVHQPSFQYVNRIIEDWHSKGARSLKDVEELDRKHQEKAKQNSGRFRSSSDTPGKKNAFHNFDQRTYNYQELEEQLLSRGRR